MPRKQRPVPISATALRIVAVIQAHRGLAPPSVRDICRAVGRAPNAVHQHLRRLRDMRILVWEPHRYRTLRLRYRLCAT